MHQQPITNAAFPLSWPAGRPRTPENRRAVAKFGDRSFAVARDQLLTELKRLGGVKQIVLSTNVELRGDGLPYAGRRAPDDPGVALYFIDRKGRQMAFACDRWRHIEDNMRAVEKTIEALRGIERWGSGEMLDAAFTGFQALPAAANSRPWWVVLGCAGHASQVEVIDAYRPPRPQRRERRRRQGGGGRLRRVQGGKGAVVTAAPPAPATAAVPLTRGLVAVVDAADYPDVSRFKWHAHRGRTTWYARRDVVVEGVKFRVYLHRHLAGDGPPIVDHRNGNGLDNRRQNLRGATHQQNGGNVNRRNGSSSFKGVSWDKARGKWAASIRVNYKRVSLGRFSDERAAAEAYDAAARRHFGEFARPNFPEHPTEKGSS